MSGAAPLILLFAVSLHAQEAAVFDLIRQARQIQPGAARALDAAEGSSWELLPDEALVGGEQHTRHAALFGRYAVGYNLQILKAIDLVQAKYPDGGGYFTGVHAKPPESPIGYPLSLFGRRLLNPPRKTSYCTGATYAAFIEALQLILPAAPAGLTEERLESLTMQEPDGSRREDGVKFWGHWNADDFGLDYALVQYAKMGKVIAPELARAGDFMNVSWKNHGSHSTIFLGWRVSKKAGRQLLLWSSQESTDGIGDYLVPLTDVAGVKVVRLTDPSAVGTFDPATPVSKDVSFDDVTLKNPFSKPAKPKKRGRK